MKDRFASIKHRLAMIEKLKDAQRSGLDTIKDSTGELGDDSILHPALKNLGKGIERNEDAEARQQALLDSDPNKADYDRLSKTRDSLADAANFGIDTIDDNYFDSDYESRLTEGSEGYNKTLRENALRRKSKGLEDKSKDAQTLLDLGGSPEDLKGVDVTNPNRRTAYLPIDTYFSEHQLGSEAPENKRKFQQDIIDQIRGKKVIK